MFDIGLLTIIVLAGLSVVWFTLKIGISPMPSSEKAKRAILRPAKPRVMELSSSLVLVGERCSLRWRASIRIAG